MSSAKKAKKRYRSSASSKANAGEMPVGDMNRPFAEGLTEMPSGADTNDSGHGGFVNSNSPMDGGLMPGESAEPVTVTDDGMPGGDMTST